MVEVEAVVIGSGFGGAIAACRLAKRWPGRVVVVERGKRYPLGGFARAPQEIANNFWNVPHEARPHPGHVATEQRGLFDVRDYRHMTVVQAAGLGGGSLIYANVFMAPPDHVFSEHWPISVRKADVEPYYAVAKDVLGARPIPRVDGDPRRRISRTEAYADVAVKLGRKSELVDLMVDFGGMDDANLRPPGEQAANRYGALQGSCTYCAECDIGCNIHAKNTVDLNYLHVAENVHGARILTEHQADRIEPLDSSGEPDRGADGSHGYRVHVLDHATERMMTLDTQRVVLSAGTLGTNEILLRNRDVHRTLPAMSARLGHGYSGNGDFLSFIVNSHRSQPLNPNHGPVITQRIDFNLFEDHDPRRAFILEDAGYPSVLAWYIEGAKPGPYKIRALARTIRDVVRQLARGTYTGRIGYALRDVLGDDLSRRSAVLLCMGLDQGNGRVHLDKAGWIDVDWRYRDSMPLYRSIIGAGKAFRDAVDAELFFPLPTFLWPFRKDVTVHSLGGCAIGTSESTGVVSARPGHVGQVFGYRNLFAADGSIVPGPVGANPAATIAALSEMVAEGITGVTPTPDL